MKIYTIANQKGGVGKTTTAHTIGAGLHRRGFRVLAVDADPQCSLSFLSGIREAEADLADILKGAAPSLQAIIPTAAGYDLIPGSSELSQADITFTQPGREYMLKEALEPLREKYDYCIIDTPPALGVLSINALTAAQAVIVPMEAGALSMQGLSQLYKTIETVQKYCNHDLQIAGLLLTRYNTRTRLNRKAKEDLEGVADFLKTHIFESSIREATAIKEAQYMQTDIFTDYPREKVTADYEALIDELTGTGKEG